MESEFDVNTWLSSGIAAAERGDHAQARALLTQIVTQEEDNAEAWWWLSRVVETAEEREVCLENVLTLEPQHMAARTALVALRQEPMPVPPPSLTPIPPPILPRAVPPSHFNDSYLCVYCAQVTGPDDFRCPSCGQPLWEEKLLVERPRTAYRLLIVLEGLLAIGALFLPLLLLTYVQLYWGLDNFLLLIPFYLNPGNAPAVAQTSYFVTVPPALIGLTLLPAVLSVLLAGGLILRIQKWHSILSGIYLLRLFIVMMLLLFVMSIGATPSPLEGGTLARTTQRFSRMLVIGSHGTALVGAITAMLMFWGLADHYTVTEKRLLQEISKGIKDNSVSLWITARACAQAEMWALAILHLQRALVIQPALEVYLLLIFAYIQLEYFDLAEHTLATARAFAPSAPQLDALARELADQRVRVSIDTETL